MDQIVQAAVSTPVAPPKGEWYWWAMAAAHGVLGQEPSDDPSYEGLTEGFLFARALRLG